MPIADAAPWDLFLRGGVAGLLVFHLANLAAPGPRPAARAALAGFVASVFAYLFCQQADHLLRLPRPLAYALLALCVAGGAWMWVAVRALFDDRFRFGAVEALSLAAVTLLGLAANVPYFPEGDGLFRTLPAGGGVAWLGMAHAVALLGFAGASLWEVLRGWRADLVAARRVARRWVAGGIAAYAALALVVELALRGHAVGPLLPALHVAGIGLIALALALLVARRSLDEVLGNAPPATPAPAPAPAPPGPPVPPDKTAQALARLDEAMTRDHLYRQEGLTLAGLAQALGLGEAPLRELINQRLGYRNFNDFLHHHRLNEAAARIAAEDLPILSIALECGYGSIGPFNRAFRQRWGMTPSEHRGAARQARQTAN